MTIILDDIAILSIKGVIYRFDFNGIRKSEAVNLLQNANFVKKVGYCMKKWIKKIIKFDEIEIKKHKFH